MALFNRFIIKDFTKERYLALVREHPRLGEEKVHIYIMLSLTFAALSFLGMFAINPTLTTIVELNKKLSDSEFVNQALKTKISNLSSLNTQYEALMNTWPIVDAAVPNDPRVVAVLGQIQAIAKVSNVQLSVIQSFEVELTNNIIRKSALPKEASYVFTITAEGSKENLLQFVKTVSGFDRIVAIEAINYSNEEKQSVTIRARTFFSP
jgi:Tfp pilus assembly protein PilO